MDTRDDSENFNEKFIDRHTSIIVPKKAERKTVYVEPFQLKRNVS
jgi:hypothetical protein